MDLGSLDNIKKPTITVLLSMDAACRFNRIELSALALVSTSQPIGLIPMALTQAAMLATMVHVHVHTSSDDVSACSTCNVKYACIHSFSLDCCKDCHQVLARSLIEAHTAVYKVHNDMEASLHHELYASQQRAACDAAEFYLEATQYMYKGTLKLPVSELLAFRTELCNAENALRMSTLEGSDTGELELRNIYLFDGPGVI